MDDEYVNQLVGEKLSAVVFVMDYCQFQFDGPVLTVLTPVTVSSSGGLVTTGDDQFRNRLCEQIGKVVRQVEYRWQDALVIEFEDASTLSVSLKLEDYCCAEAVMFIGNDGVWDVIRSDSP